MQFKIHNTIKNNLFSASMLIISLAFYLFFAFFDGAVICVDSPGYIEMNISREPFYPLFLAFFRLLFGGASSDFYLFAAIVVQSILAAASAWSLAAFLHREFRLNKPLSLLILFIPMAVSLLCRFAALRGSMYSNSIMTEGIAISCYLLFFRYLFEYTLRQTKRSFFACGFLTFLLISTRKQMVISLFMLVICIFIVYFKKKNYLGAIVVSMLCSFFILLCNAGLDLGYNYILRGEAVTHSSDTRFITTMAFYTAERDDYQYIEDENIENLFLEIYDICDENNYLKSSAESGWLNRVSHFGDFYDCIQIDTMWPHISAYAKEHYGDDIVDINVNTDLIMNTINSSVIPHNIGKIAATFLDNFLSGLITTVAQRNALLIWYSFFIYMLYILLLFYHMRRKQSRSLFLFSILTLFSIILNVGLVSLVIFCQTRYTIYNMALFYISLLLMLYEPAGKLLKGRQHAV